MDDVMVVYIYFFFFFLINSLVNLRLLQMHYTLKTYHYGVYHDIFEVFRRPLDCECYKNDLKGHTTI